MKRILKIFAVVSAVLAVCGCEGTAEVPSDEVVLPPGSYIFFDSQVSTRGELVTTLEEKSFAVTGFKYKGDWNTVRGGEMKPNVFHNQEVAWDGSAHSYDASTSPLNKYTDIGGNKLPLIPWADEDTLYTFFAHYPVADGTVVKMSGTTVDGEPYIDYTLSRTDPSEMRDIMTAYKVRDIDNSLSNSVGFTMKHRLAAIDVHLSNYINNVIVDDDEKEVSVIVSNLTVNFANLLYSGVSLWLDPAYHPDPAYPPGVRSYTTASPQTATFTMLTDLADTPIKIGKNSKTNISNEGKSLIVIPQSAYKSGEDNVFLNGSVTFDFAFVDSSGNPVEVPLVDEDDSDSDGNKEEIILITSGLKTMPFDTYTDILEGQKYYIQITFLNGAITLDVTSGAAWIDKNIEIEFD